MLTQNKLARRRIVLAILAGSILTGTGCSSMSSGKGWWSSTGGSVYSAGATAASGVGGQIRSMGATVSSAAGKAKNSLLATFTPGTEKSISDKDDPTSLTSMPGKLTPELWVMQGQLAESQGQHAKALESYNKALETEPNKHECRVLRFSVSTLPCSVTPI